MKREKKSEEDSDLEIEKRIEELVVDLEGVEMKVKGLKTELNGIIGRVKARREVEREKEKEELKTQREKGSWKIGDSVKVRNSFRYRGSLKRHSAIEGIVTKVTKDWVWFSVQRWNEAENRYESEAGYYRKRYNLENQSWGLC